MKRLTTLIARLGPSLPAAVVAVVCSLAIAQGSGGRELTVLTHDSFTLPQAVIDEFTAATGVRVVFLAGGDAGEVVNRAILTKARPLADVLFGVDDSLLERARVAGIFEPYFSDELARVPEDLRFDPQGLVTPVDVGYVLPNVDREWFETSGLPLPAALEDLVEGPYRGLSVVQNPASSSPGLAFLLATVARFGDAAAGLPAAAATADGGDWLDFWAALRDNDVAVTDGWSDAYYTSFTRYGGDRPVVLSYLTSPAAEMIFAEEALDEPPTANLTCEGCAYRQIEAIGILAGTDERAAAEQFIDFMLSRSVQEAIPLAMFVHPVVVDANLPSEFERFAVLPASAAAASVPSSLIQAHQERWLAQWTAVVLHGRDPGSVR